MRYVEAIDRRRLKHRKKHALEEQKFNTMIPSVIPIEKIIKSIRTGKARFFEGAIDDLDEGIPYETVWEPKSKLNEEVIKENNYKLEIKHLKEELETLEKMSKSFMQEIHKKDLRISELKSKYLILF
jgi:hypothetical protein